MFSLADTNFYYLSINRLTLCSFATITSLDDPSEHLHKLVEGHVVVGVERGHALYQVVQHGRLHDHGHVVGELLL